MIKVFDNRSFSSLVVQKFARLRVTLKQRQLHSREWYWRIEELYDHNNNLSESIAFGSIHETLFL